MKKMHKIIRITAIVLALAVIAGIGLWIYADQYSKRDFVASMTEQERYQYNYSLTLYGRNYQYTGKSDVLIVENIQKNLGGNTEVSFRIYSYSNSTLLSEALKMTCADMDKDQRFVFVGTGTVTLLDDQMAKMANMKTLYYR